MLHNGCVLLWPQNDRIATFEKTNDRYIVEVTGTRIAVGHDLIDVILPHTFKDRQQYDLPRIEGKIDGSEIRHGKGHWPYVGTITIHDKLMTIDLKYDKAVYKRLDKDLYSGRYKLVEKK